MADGIAYKRIASLSTFSETAEWLNRGEPFEFTVGMRMDEADYQHVRSGVAKYMNGVPFEISHRIHNGSTFIQFRLAANTNKEAKSILKRR